MKDIVISHFFSLLRAGLWEQNPGIPAEEPIDFEALFKVAEEQSVLGVVTAGIEHLEGREVSKYEVKDFMWQVIYLDDRNASMNAFIADLFKRLEGEGIRAMLVKGQGIAQCYERPMWRMSGDIDLLLDADNYLKAKAFLCPLAEKVSEEQVGKKHLGMYLGPWHLELHGTMRTGLPGRANAVIDRVQQDCMDGDVRLWRNGDIDIPLPGPTNDALLIFTHFLTHFFYGGIGLRQVCDWCRLLWTYRDSIDRGHIEDLVRQTGLVSEWKAFAAFAVDNLGLPVEAMPLYDASPVWQRKARRIHSFIMETGNFGHNRDKSYYSKYPYLVYKAISLWGHIRDFFKRLMIFPLDSLRVFGLTLVGGVKAVAEGK